MRWSALVGSFCFGGHTGFGFSDAFGFSVWAVAVFEVLRGRVLAAFGLARFLLFDLGRKA